MKIPVVHLPDGHHEFSSTIEGGSLTFDRQDVYPEPIVVTVNVDKFEDNLKLRVHLKTNAHYTCDRCLEDIVRPFEREFELLVHLGDDHWETDEEDVIPVTEDMTEVDISGWIIEHLILDIPIKVVFTEPDSDRCVICGRDALNQSFSTGEDDIDPRWAKLKNLKKS